MPRFALLDHDHPTPHWDLLLERAGVLWTWRLNRLPEPGTLVEAERIGNHRLLYLDYEGPVSGDRGRVLRVDGGGLTWQHGDADTILVELQGQRYRGTLAGRAIQGELWEFVYSPA